MRNTKLGLAFDEYIVLSIVDMISSILKYIDSYEVKDIINEDIDLLKNYLEVSLSESSKFITLSNVVKELVSFVVDDSNDKEKIKKKISEKLPIILEQTRKIFLPAYFEFLSEELSVNNIDEIKPVLVSVFHISITKNPLHTAYLKIKRKVLINSNKKVEVFTDFGFYLVSLQMITSEENSMLNKVLRENELIDLRTGASCFNLIDRVFSQVSKYL